MISLSLQTEGRPLNIVCVGAHSDDIEIGAGAFLQRLCHHKHGANVMWCVMSAIGARAEEARLGAERFAQGASGLDLRLGTFRDGYLPYHAEEAKEWLISQRDTNPAPDLVLTHNSLDAHQDHRLVNELVWSLWRDSLIMEFEIPKWDGDLTRPNFYLPLEAGEAEKKLEGLDSVFQSQQAKDWFDPTLFQGLMRIRGAECRSPSGYAEAFHVRKAAVQVQLAV